MLDLKVFGCIHQFTILFTCRVHRHFPGTEQEAARCRYKNQIRAVTLQYEVLKTEKLRRTWPANQCLWVRGFLRKMQGDDHSLTPRSVPSGCWVCPTPSCWSLTPSCPWLSEKSLKSHCRVLNNDGSSRPMAEMSCDPVPGVPKTFRRLLAGYLIHRHTPAGMKSCMSWVAQEHPTDWIAVKYRWNMEKEETRNTQLFRTIYQDDSLSRCKTDCEGWPWCAISGLLWVASSRWPESKSFWHDCSCGCESRVPIRTEPQCVCVCVCVPGLVIYENEACSSWLLMECQQMSY